ncbi:MAG TPA: amidase [Bryobacteraceae bacterium]|nr:amidase [Bryobacteraceae bacterium]
MPSRREFLYAAAAMTAARASAEAPELEEATLADLQAGLAAGRFTSAALVEQYHARIATVDQKIHSVIELNPDAGAIAAALDRERKQKGPRGPLHGLPILIKDNIDTADKMQTTAGSLALAGSPAPKDAALVTRLRDAGAVLLGKTNLSEWANYRSSHSTSGWSGRGGQTRNPYVLDRNPSGSSSGSGAAVAASLCAAAVGTETDGSVVSPASMCGIVGIKPTIGLIPGQGIIPISHRQDTAGPMARTVADAALLLGALAGATYGRALEPNGMKGARIGVARQLFGFNDAVDAMMVEVLGVLSKLGAELIDPVNIPGFSKLSEMESEAMSYEFKADLNAYLGARGGPVLTLADLIAFNEKNRAREMPHFGQDLFTKAEARGPLSSKAYRDLESKLNRAAKGDGMDRAMIDNKLDALVAPTDSPAWPIDYVLGDHQVASTSTPAAIAGYPHITVPAFQVSGLPVGLSFFGSPRTEVKLIRYAFTFEQAMNARRPPAYLATVKA